MIKLGINNYGPLLRKYKQDARKSKNDNRTGDRLLREPKSKTG